MPIAIDVWSALWILMAWCCSTRASVAKFLSMHPCACSCLWVDPTKLSIAGYDNVIKLKYFSRCCPFVMWIHQSPVNSLNKGQWRGALMFFLICAWINAWVNNREAGDLRRHRAHYDVILMKMVSNPTLNILNQLLTCNGYKLISSIFNRGLWAEHIASYQNIFVHFNLI